MKQRGIDYLLTYLHHTHRTGNGIDVNHYQRTAQLLLSFYNRNRLPKIARNISAPNKMIRRSGTFQFPSQFPT